MYLSNQLTKNDQNIQWLNLQTFENNGFIATSGNTIEKLLFNGKMSYTLTKKNNNLNTDAIEITVPPYNGDISGQDYSVLWVQLLNDRLSTFKVFRKNQNGSYTIFGKFASGYRSLNNITPDGSIHNENWNLFEWYPIPIKLDSTRKILINNPYSIVPGINDTPTYFSGFAFSTNPWNHFRISPRTLELNLNDTDESVIFNQLTKLTFNNNNWNNDQLNQIVGISTITIRIPFVNSGRNKVFYIIEHNSFDYAGYTTYITINNVNVGNLYTTFDNPFSRHFNSKLYNRYFGVIIPKEILPVSDNYIIVKFTIPLNSILYFREVGTHDETIIY
jgi:hypothetical protein